MCQTNHSHTSSIRFPYAEGRWAYTYVLQGHFGLRQSLAVVLGSQD